MSEARIDELEERVDLLCKWVKALQHDQQTLEANLRSGLGHAEANAIIQAKEEIAEEYSLDEAGDGLSHIDVLVDSLHQLAGEADELEARNDVDDHLQHVIEGLRSQARDVQNWLNEYYYDDPVTVLDTIGEGEAGE